MLVNTDLDRRRYGKAVDELVGWFSSNVGVQAQGYEPGHEFESSRAHLSRLIGMLHGNMRWFDRVAATLARLPLAERTTLSLIYSPHGAPTWLADALSTPWGGGSFIRLAATLERAATAAQSADPAVVLTFFESQGRGSKTALFRALRDDCESMRMPVLAAYDILRVERIKAEQEADRERARARAERSAALLEEELQMTRRIKRARFERRLRGGARP